MTIKQLKEKIPSKEVRDAWREHSTTETKILLDAVDTLMTENEILRKCLVAARKQITELRSIND